MILLKTIQIHLAHKNSFSTWTHTKSVLASGVYPLTGSNDISRWLMPLSWLALFTSAVFTLFYSKPCRVALRCQYAQVPFMPAGAGRDLSLRIKKEKKNPSRQPPLVVFHNWPNGAGALCRFPTALLKPSLGSDKDRRAVVWKCDWWLCRVRC